VGEVVGMDRDVAGVTELTIAWCQWDTWQDAEALVRSFAGLRKFSLRNCDPIRCAPIDYLFELLPQGLDALEFDTTCLEDECISTLLPQLIRFTHLSSLKVWRAFCQDWAFGPALQHLPPSIAELSVELVSLLPIRRRWRVVLTETPYQAVSALLADVEWLPKLYSFSLGSLPAEDEQEKVLSNLCSKRGIRYGRLEKESFDPDGNCGVPPATQDSDCLARLRSLAAIFFLSHSLIIPSVRATPSAIKSFCFGSSASLGGRNSVVILANRTSWLANDLPAAKEAAAARVASRRRVARPGPRNPLQRIAPSLKSCRLY
jgi:hypothetical protein